MEGQFYFMGIAGLAVSLAGFAWLVSAFRLRSEAWSEVELRRLRTILVLFYIGNILRTARRDPHAWPAGADVTIHYALDGLFGLLQLANVFWGSLGVVELGLMLLLTYPASIFLRTVGAFKPGSNPPQ